MLQDDPDPVRFGYRAVSSDGGTFVELLQDGNSLERNPLPPGVVPAAHAMRRLREMWISWASAPATVMEPGIISRKEAEALIRELGHLCHRMDAREVNPDSELVRIAAELGLQPVAPRSNPNRVTANCPGTHHFIMISPKAEEFGCGYCRRKGGPKELLAFYRERRGRTSSRTEGRSE